MSNRIKATFHDGAFIPQQPFDLPEGAQVELVIEGPTVTPPEVSDPEERRQILNAMVDRMIQNPIPADAPRFSREELHERR